jgi:hypothetical protein
MTVGTAIVVSVGIIAAAWIVTMAIGAWLANKKQKNATDITNAISKKILENRDKK